MNLWESLFRRDAESPSRTGVTRETRALPGITALWQRINFHQSVTGGVTFAPDNGSRVPSGENENDRGLSWVGRGEPAHLDFRRLTVLPVVIGGYENTIGVAQ